MEAVQFRQMPLIVKIAVGLVFNNAWWSIEEFVINRNGLWKYMPYYKTTNGCVWDLAVAVIAIVAISWASGAGRNLRSTNQLQTQR
jgi:hypothetical protein